MRYAIVGLISWYAAMAVVYAGAVASSEEDNTAQDLLAALLLGALWPYMLPACWMAKKIRSTPKEKS